MRGIQRIISRAALGDEIRQLSIAQAGGKLAVLKVFAEMRNALALVAMAAGAGGRKQLLAVFG